MDQPPSPKARKRPLGFADLVGRTGEELYATLPPDPQLELRRTNPVAYWKKRGCLDAWGGDEPTAPWLPGSVPV
jgi:hypothetical protein